MRWHKTQHGDVRHRTKFAWLPLTIDKERVWLESYHTKEIYQEYRTIAPCWVTVDWSLTFIDKSD